MITIIVADDHPLVRKGLRALLESEPDFTIVGEVSNGLEAVQLSEQLRPDVLILDLQMPISLKDLADLPKCFARVPRGTVWTKLPVIWETLSISSLPALE